MKRSVRKLVGSPVTIPGHPVGFVTAAYLTLRPWAVRHISIRLAGGTGLTVSTSSVSTIPSRPSTHNSLALTISPFGRFHHPSVLSLGEAPGSQERASESVLRFTVATVDGEQYKLADLAVDDRTWDIDFIVISDAGGRSMAVFADDVRALHPDVCYVTVDSIAW